MRTACFYHHTDPEQPKVDCENSEVQRRKPKDIQTKLQIIFLYLFQHCIFAPSKFSQSTLVVLSLLVVKLHTICPSPCPFKTMCVSRHTLAQLCDWKGNIVWWECREAAWQLSSFSLTTNKTSKKSKKKTKKKATLSLAVDSSQVLKTSQINPSKPRNVAETSVLKITEWNKHSATFAIWTRAPYMQS